MEKNVLYGSLYRGKLILNGKRIPGVQFSCRPDYQMYEVMNHYNSGSIGGLARVLSENGFQIIHLKNGKNEIQTVRFSDEVLRIGYWPFRRNTVLNGRGIIVNSGFSQKDLEMFAKEFSGYLLS